MLQLTDRIYNKLSNNYIEYILHNPYNYNRFFYVCVKYLQEDDVLKKERGKSGEGRGKPPREGFSSPLFSPSQGFFTKWGGKAEGSSSVFQSAATRKRVVACFGRFAPLID